jgi:hypothetical protein
MSDQKFDCILIPGGGLLEDGSLPAWVQARLDTALEYQDQTNWLIPLSGGTVHKPPPLDAEGYPIFESRQAAQFLLAKGIQPGRILTEYSSYDTIGNAYFARALFCEPLALSQCLVVTSDFHLARCQAIFEWIYSLVPLQHDFKLSFISSPDVGLDSQILAARRKREENSLNALQQKTRKLTTLSRFYHWLYTEHAAYAPGITKETLSKEDKRSY